MLVIRSFDMTDDLLWQEAMRIRELVFIQEQACPYEEEFDGLDHSSTHFLGYWNDVPVATSRLREVNGKVKLERFAVLSEVRGKGIGKSMVKESLALALTMNKPVYLHAQTSVCSLYAQFGFQKTGAPFDEVGIQHYVMTLATPVAL
ncbi:MAG: GNAT family N-acetyltransferase [Flavobacteriales bacterium]|nr:GNAT family N-acetyltransferase [Flavobacteriales bacterium]